MDTSDIRRRFEADPDRPRYHYLPPSNWMNDPNGLIQWQGQYHLFYQYNPDGPLWGNIHWGHAVSPDLIHWADLPIALAPTPGPDETGCFSGCAVNDNGPVLIYTGVRGERHDIQTQCIATPASADLVKWDKHPRNPVISEVPAEAMQTKDFRDPFVWKEGDMWYMVLASCIRDNGGVIFIYRSPDLIEWEYLGPLLTGDKNRNGVIWECPNFFKLGDQWVLIISSIFAKPPATILYFVGSYENHRFTPTYEGVFDYGEMYAPQTFVDDDNRRLLFGWMRESRSREGQQKAGWSGIQSIPRELKLNADGQLIMMPVPELEAIRGSHHHFNADTAKDTLLENIPLALDIMATFAPQANATCGLQIACTPESTEYADIVYDAASQRLVVTSVSPEASEAVSSHVREASHTLAAGENLQLRILVDGSLIEIIANDRTSLTARLYPSRAERSQVRLLGAKSQVRSLDIWEMPSIWQ